jgi:hypothetical protein
VSYDLHFEDFTEAGYRRVLTEAKHRYQFEPFGTRSRERHVLWRHDVDFSVHRAVRLAGIEAEEGVTSTYFLGFHSSFYNLLERSVADLAREIVGLGNRLGLHFDSSFYGTIESTDELAEKIASEARMLADLLETPVDAFSFHNPGVVNDDLAFDADEIGGLLNVYSRRLRETYGYVSDANGHWRFRRLLDVLLEGTEACLHVLTHPGWWQAEPMPPRERVVRCVQGRAAGTLREYDDLLARAGRMNIR